MSTADYHDFLQARLMEGIREFTKPQRQRQQERHWTKKLIGRTMAAHVSFLRRPLWD